MSHEISNIDQVGLFERQAWHNLGIVIQDSLTAVQAAHRFGMTWSVDGWELEAVGPNGERIKVPTHKANIRTADCHGNPIEELLGVVGSDYQTCQNLELARFTDALADSGEVMIESCGSIRRGKRVWFLARGEAFNVGDQDKVYPYILVSNGHDGSQSIRVTPTTVRVVCSNTLHMVVPREEGIQSESAAITIRHSGKISDKLEQARHALKYYGSVLARNKEMFDLLQGKKLDREQGLALFAKTYASNWETATQEELNSADKKERRLAENRLTRMEKACKAFLSRREQEASITGDRDSAWAWMNAMTGYIQHDVVARGSDDSARVERRVDSNLFGLNCQRTNSVLNEVLALAS